MTEGSSLYAAVCDRGNRASFALCRKGSRPAEQLSGAYPAEDYMPCRPGSDQGLGVILCM